MKEDPQPLLADRFHDAPLHCLLAQAGEGPLSVGKSEVAGSTQREVDQRPALVVGELRRSPRPPLRLQHGLAMFVEGADHSSNVVLARQSDDGDPWGRVALVAGEDDLGALELDGVLAVTHDTTELLPFLEAQLTDPEDHGVGIANPGIVLPVQTSTNFTGRATS